MSKNKIVRFTRPETGRRKVKIIFKVSKFTSYEDEEVSIRKAARGQLHKIKPLRSKHFKTFRFMESLTASELKRPKTLRMLDHKFWDAIRDELPDGDYSYGVDAIIDQETKYDWRWYLREKLNYEWPQYTFGEMPKD